MPEKQGKQITVQFADSSNDGSTNISMHLDPELSSKLEFIAARSGLDRAQLIETMVEQWIAKQWQSVVDAETQNQIDPVTGWSKDDLELLNSAGLKVEQKPSDPIEVERIRDRAYRAIPKKLRAQSREGNGSRISATTDNSNEPG